jgi:hypothetical protein
MAGIATDLLPGDAELARRAAGGDGAAFVYLYDRYSAGVFETSLAATGAVEAAADATQSAFLKLLRRPPAMGAPGSEVAERLRALAIAGVGETPTSHGGAESATYAPYGVGVGWLRSETVAKAGARFDDDWSAHLSQPHAAERVTSETPLPVISASAVAADPLPPLKPVSKPRAHRRERPAWLSLPSPAMAAAVLLLAMLCATAWVVVTSGGSDGNEPAPAPATVARAEPRTEARRAERSRPEGRRAAARPSRATRPNAARPGSPDQPAATHRGGVRLPTGTARRPSPGGRLRTLTGPTGATRPQKITPTTRTPTTVRTSPPQAPPPPAPVQQAPPAQTTQPAPTPTTAEPAPAPTGNGQGNLGANRNCNSKKNPEPC